MSQGGRENGSPETREKETQKKRPEESEREKRRGGIGRGAKEERCFASLAASGGAKKLEDLTRRRTCSEARRRIATLRHKKTNRPLDNEGRVARYVGMMKKMRGPSPDNVGAAY